MMHFVTYFNCLEHVYEKVEYLMGYTVKEILDFIGSM